MAAVGEAYGVKALVVESEDANRAANSDSIVLVLSRKEAAAASATGAE